MTNPFTRLEGDRERITSFGVSILDIIQILSDGNPGAVNVCAQLMNSYSDVDPESAMGPLSGLLSLDSYGIYGPNIWVLYKDICGEDIVNVIVVLRGIQLDVLDRDLVYDSIRQNRPLFDMDEYRTKVENELEEFNLDGVTQ